MTEITWSAYEHYTETIPTTWDVNEIAGLHENINSNPTLTAEQKRLLLDYLRYQARQIRDRIAATIQAIGNDIEEV